jgi:flagellar hook-basal body complex protein FliE
MAATLTAAKAEKLSALADSLSDAVGELVNILADAEDSSIKGDERDDIMSELESASAELAVAWTVLGKALAPYVDGVAEQ